MSIYVIRVMQAGPSIHSLLVNEVRLIDCVLS